MSAENTSVEPAVDEAPVLEGTAPEFVENVEGVDMESFPALQPLKSMRVSKRNELRGELLKIAQLAPEDYVDGEIDEEVLLNDTESFDTFVEMLKKIEDVVLDLAEDRDAMDQWLISQDDGEQALMAAFGRVSELLGN